MHIEKIKKIIWNTENKRKPYIRIINYMVLLLSVCNILLAVTNPEILETDILSGTAYDQSSDFYTDNVSEQADSIQQVFRPKHRGLKSIAVRLEDAKSDMSADLMVSITDGKKKIWEKQIDKSELTNWRYVEIDVSDAKCGLYHTYTLNISSLVSGQETSYRLYLAGKPIKENQKLLSNGISTDAELDIVYRYHTLDICKLLFLIAGEIILILFGMILPLNQKEGYGKGFAVAGGIAGDLFVVQSLSDGNIAMMSANGIFLNLCIIAGIYLLLLLLTGRYTISALLTSGILFLSAMANHFVLQFRGTVILPSDIYSIKTASNVAMNYSLFWDQSLMIALAVVLVNISVTCWLTGAFDTTEKKRVLGVAAVVWIVNIVVSTSTSVRDYLGTGLNQSAQTSRSKEIGFLLNFCENIPYFIYQKPEGYSLEYAASVLPEQEYAEETMSPDNIIVIMNESFTDLGFLGELEANQEYLPNFYRVINEENSKMGKCVTSVFGGGTSCTEFEFLTGSSMLFLGSGNAPYQQYIHSATGSLASYLSATGYSSVALHPANPVSWNRQTAYSLLGFSNFLNDSSEEFMSVSRCRYWVDDRALMTEMYRQSMLKDPLFQFGLTIQCHGGYDYDGDDFENTVHVINYEDEEGTVSQYLSLVSMSDQAFGELIDKLEADEKKTIVLMFGDHLPSLSDDFYNQLMGEEEDQEKELLLHETPYLFWANYDVSFDEIPEVMSANFLSPYLLKFADVPLSPYYRYLYDLSQEYPVVSRTAVLNADGDFCEYTKEDSCYDRIHDYEIVQYAVLHGNLTR